MKFDLVTLFPEYFEAALRQSLLGKAIDKKLFDIKTVNPRDFTTDKHRTVDDTPFGGGGGMVMKVEPLDLCLQSLGYGPRGESGDPDEKAKILLTSASGKPFNQQRAIRYSLCDRLTIICGHYLGLDERIVELYDIEEISVGDYILTGGEPAAAVIVDAVARLIPGVLGNFESALEDSFMNEILGAPCYTRPPEYKGLKVPEVLLSGDHSAIRRFRREQAIRKCFSRRPDLLETAELTDEDLKFIETLKKNRDTT